MTTNPTSSSPPDASSDPQSLAASSLRRLGHALASRSLPPAASLFLAAQLDSLAASIAHHPPRTTQPTLPTGREAEEGRGFPFDAHSIVAGPRNPFGIGAGYRRRGDTCVAACTFGRAFEGPAGRVHGGAVAMVVDECTAAAVKMLGLIAFTGSMSVRLLRAAPLDVEVEFVARVDRREGRKLFVSCVGKGPEGVFVEAEAVYIEAKPAGSGAGAGAGADAMAKL
ncbi:HotDog domain-containing protein [Hyaloraphidium curvatum]|nr:HotDog domain-containing protein [Hyaloraphidium curvatum]